MAGKTLGHIDCPTCGTHKGMRITHDKNGDPFGYCEVTCSQQMRIGGEKSRVRRFIERFPWAASPVTVTPPEPAPAQKAKPVPAPAPVPEITPVKTPAPSAISNMAAALQFLKGNPA
jgi:hypothetical protein